jgi:basic membrane lipoprotein Med (substrate-binding protein (PBP1-ABC) superfamily)
MRVPAWLGRYWKLLAAGAAGTGMAVAAVAWLTGGSRLPPARARVYSAFSACLLTGAAGVADPRVAPVWAGLEQASQATRAKVSFMQVTGPATVGNAMPYVGALGMRHCNVIVAAGPPEAAAVTAESARFPATRFVVVGGAGRARANVTVIAAGAPGAVQAGVASLVEGAAA